MRLFKVNLIKKSLVLLPFLFTFANLYFPSTPKADGLKPSFLLALYAEFKT